MATTVQYATFYLDREYLGVDVLRVQTNYDPHTTSAG